MNNSLAMAAAAAALQPQTSLGFPAAASNGGSTGASRRESMDRGSNSTFSPSVLEQYKNKGWPTYNALGTGKFRKAFDLYQSGKLFGFSWPLAFLGGPFNINEL